MAYALLRNGTLIDGNGGEPLKNAAVLVEDQVIKAVGHEQSIKLPDADLQTIDAQGGFILPGLFDSHVHIMLQDISIPRLMAEPFSVRFYNSTLYMRRTLDAGITSVRDAGGADAGVKQAIEQGIVAGPRIQISIMPLTITGGHGDGWMLSGNEFKLLPDYTGMPDGRCDGVEEVRKRVREMLRAGAEVIKVHATGGVMSPTDHPEFTQFSPEELSVMVQEGAYRRGVKVMAHAQGAEGIKNAVRAGIHSIEHGIFLDDEAIELMVAHGTYLVPTLLAVVAVVESAEAVGMPDYALRKAKEVIDIHLESIARAHKAGVRIAMGTDAGVMPHGTNLRELGLMAKIGMSPMEVLTATTRTAAECLGWDDHLGTIEVGKLADIVIARTDPLADLESLEDTDNIRLVMKDGLIVKELA